MVPYYSLIIFVYLLFAYSIYRRDKDTVLFNISMISLFIFAAIRGNGDYDYFNYKEYSLLFQTMNDVLYYQFLEIGFRLISLVNNLLNMDSQFVIIYMNLISFVAMYFVINKMSSNKMLSVVVLLPFYFQLDMHSSRTAVAVSLGLVAFYFLANHKYFKMIVFILFAMSFHITAAILFMMPLFYNKYIIDKIIAVRSIFLLAFLWIVKNFLSIIGIVVLILNTLGQDRLVFKIESYLDTKFGQPFSLLDPRLLLALILFVVLWMIKNKIYILSYKNENNRTQTSKYLDLMFVVSFINILVYILFSDATIIVVRFTHYFNMITLISIPYVIKCLDYSLRTLIPQEKKYYIGVCYLSLMIVYLGYTLIVLPKVPYLIYSW